MAQTSEGPKQRAVTENIYLSAWNSTPVALCTKPWGKYVRELLQGSDVTNDVWKKPTYSCFPSRKRKPLFKGCEPLHPQRSETLIPLETPICWSNWAYLTIDSPKIIKVGKVNHKILGPPDLNCKIPDHHCKELYSSGHPHFGNPDVLHVQTGTHWVCSHHILQTSKTLFLSLPTAFFSLLFPDGLQTAWKVSMNRGDFFLETVGLSTKRGRRAAFVFTPILFPCISSGPSRGSSLRAFVHFLPGPLPTWATHHFLSAGTDDIILHLLPAHCKCTPRPCSPASVQFLFSNPSYLEPFKAGSLQCFNPFHSSSSSDWL